MNFYQLNFALIQVPVILFTMSSDKSAFDKWEVYTFPPELNDPYVNPCDIMEPLFHKFLEECIAAIEESEEEALLFKFAYIPPKSRDNYKGPFRYNVYRNNYVDNITQFLEFVVITEIPRSFSNSSL